MNQLNTNVLRTIAHSNPTAAASLEALAERERMRVYLDLTTHKRSLLKDGAKIVEADYNKMWEELQKAGVGSIVYGRGGKHDRFKWNYSLVNVGKAATKDEPVLIAEAPKPKAKRRGRPPKNKQAEVTTTEDTGSNILYIPLRDNVNVSIKVPKNITPKERELIKHAIDSL